MSTNPNSFDDKEIKDARANPNDPNPSGTEGEGQTPKAPAQDGEPVIDYKEKFAASSSEALRLLDENRKKDQIIAELSAKANGQAPKSDPTMDVLYPGFENLDPEAQKNLIDYTNVITARATAEVYKNPAIAHAQAVYNESKFEEAFQDIAKSFPDLIPQKEEFKSKYFKKDNPVPDNFKTILGDLAKIHLFDKAKDVGAEEERKKQAQEQERIDLERNSGGPKQSTTSRSLEDWHRMAQNNPAEFARLSKEYHADLASGKLKE